MGVVGIMQVDRHSDRIEIPIFVLSCRAFGFGIEKALLNAVRALAPAESLIVGCYKETQFNQICRQFYSASGMRWDGTQWIGRIADLSPAPQWLAIENKFLPADLQTTAAFSQDMGALLESLNVEAGQKLDVKTDPMPTPDSEQIAVRADLDETARETT
jgi:hypothetical protein